MSLIQDAARVRENAHAPYSGFKVGAAIRTVEGHVHLGCNVENVAYPEGTCAEAGAIAAMIAAGDKRIAEVAVIADCPAPVPPCGGCRGCVQIGNQRHESHAGQKQHHSGVGDDRSAGG